MTNLPRLSIIMPAHNAASTIEQAILSTVPLLDLGAELVITDDGSSDRTLQIIEAIAKSQSSIRALRQPNAGPSNARRAAFGICTGEFVTFLDADDFLDPVGMEATWRAAVQSGCPISKARIEEYPHHTPSPELEVREGQSHAAPRIYYCSESMDRWLLRTWGGFVGVVYTRSLVEHVLPVVGDLAFGEDLAFTFALAVYQPVFVQVDIVGYWYRTDQVHQSTAPDSLKRVEIISAFETCERIAVSQVASHRALLWLLIQRYRWSRARSVSKTLRPIYRSQIRAYSRGLRERLKLSYGQLIIQTVKSAYLVAVKVTFKRKDVAFE